MTYRNTNKLSKRTKKAHLIIIKATTLKLHLKTEVKTQKLQWSYIRMITAIAHLWIINYISYKIIRKQLNKLMNKIIGDWKINQWIMIMLWECLIMTQI